MDSVKTIRRAFNILLLHSVVATVVLPAVVLCQEDNINVFGGAEDNEDNTLFYQPWKTKTRYSFIGPGHNKKTRLDSEDVEMMLNPGPMIAPDIILKRFVDSRVSLMMSGNNHHHHEEMPAEMLLRNNSRILDSSSDMMTMPMIDLDKMMSDDSSQNSAAVLFYDSLGHYETINENEIEDDVNVKLKLGDSRKCFHKMKAAKGSFNLRFDEDCLIHLVNPDKDSRLILTCSPVSLGDCSTHRDSVTINLLGDMSFRQNSFLYCGKDASIRAISLRNELAIRINGSAMAEGSTQCAFHSRKYRDINLDSTSSSVECGKLGRIGKIIGGRSVPPGLFPWAVQLDITREDGSQTGCTGTIVSPYHVLTAAHCMKRAESVSAFMGGTNRHEILGTEVLIQAEKYILHRRWSQKTLTADIALVKLTEPVEYSEDISPICLPEGRLLTEDMSGKRGVAMGWGRTQTKQKAPRKLYRVKLPLMTELSCKNIYKRFFIPKMMMCTDSKKDSAICYGIMKLYNN